MAFTAVTVWCSPANAQTQQQRTTQTTAQAGDSTYIAPDGTAYITRVIPIPRTVSAAARYVLINVHGGAYEYDCCSLSESIPIASIMKSEVVAVLYRLAPEHPYPTGIDDVIAVYRELLKNHSPSEIAIYGTSSGAVMTGEVAMKLKALGLPEPAALGIFSGFGDFGQLGDSQAFFTGAGLGGHLTPPEGLMDVQRAYVGDTPLDDPVLSPMKGDLAGLPPTLFLTSTRDWFLSGTSLFDRAMLHAGDEPQLVVFDALNHGFGKIRRCPSRMRLTASRRNFLRRI